MAQQLSPEVVHPEAEERPRLEPGFLPWLRRRLLALWPRSRRHWALYAVLSVIALFLLVEWRSTITYSAQVVVIPRTDELIVGINPTTERMDFGDLTQGSSQNRPLTLENASLLPQRVSIIVLGDISQYIHISDAFFTLDAGETKKVDFTLVVPPTAETKKYSGRVLVLRIPWSPWP